MPYASASSFHQQLAHGPKLPQVNCRRECCPELWAQRIGSGRFRKRCTARDQKQRSRGPGDDVIDRGHTGGEGCRKPSRRMGGTGNTAAGKARGRRIVTDNSLWEHNSSALPEVLLIFLDFENPVTDRWILFLQQRNRDVVHRNPACRLSFQASVVRVPVNHQVGAVAINHFRQPGCPHEW